ncbi:MAG: bifunctional UDP-sugar hydrolase/5'-nucleotidase [Bacteroidales bacterium]|nr:bifunctional UDP-sugar hydrolase/5'-nucleotidase [Bacteroidales bacterium]MDZ4205142.1 bifunctional UDP-sugar hydrolase/5'-nucleotidase [Bacteroidales bacterium]
MIRRHLSFLSLACFALILSPLAAQDTLLLKIIVTTDIHGHILPFDLLENKTRTNSLAQVQAFIKREQQKGTHEIILLDNGDILQGDPFIYYYNFIDTVGVHPLASVMNYMSFDAATIGNHDIEAGHAVYDKLHKQFNFPWLSANIIDDHTNLPYFKPYTILERKGKRIAVLGLCTPLIPQWLPPTLWAGMQFGDLLSTAQNWVHYIRKNEKPDLLIGLFHSGAERVPEEEGKSPALVENAVRLIAEHVGGIGIIFSGHDHRRWNEFVSSPDEDFTLILGGGSHARAVSVATISMISSKDGLAERRETRGDIIEADRLPADQQFTNLFQHLLQPARKFVTQPIAILADSLRSRDALFGYAPFVALIHQVQLETSKAKISFAAPLSYDAIIAQGPVTWGELFKLYRYENQLYVMQLSGHEIKAVLEYSYGKWMNRMQGANDNMLNFNKRSDGRIEVTQGKRPQLATPFYNFESAAGVNYVVDLSKPAGQRIRIRSLSNGQPFVLDETYNVAVNSYRGNGGGGHLTEGAGIAHEDLNRRIKWSSDRDMRFLMKEWFEKQGVITLPTLQNWKVVPELWVEQAKLKDYQLLFGTIP